MTGTTRFEEQRDGGSAANAVRRVYAPGRHPHGVVALSRRCPDANFNLKHLIRFAQKLEEGRFDAWFMADHLAVLNMPMAALKRSATVTSFDPLTLLPALAMHTEHLGLIATASTTFEPPYTIARRFACSTISAAAAPAGTWSPPPTPMRRSISA